MEFVGKWGGEVIAMLLLLVAAALGLTFLLASLRYVATWSRFAKIVAPIGFSLFGVTPFSLLRVEILDPTDSIALISVGYFFVFTVVAPVLLTGKASRAEAAELRPRR